METAEEVELAMSHGDDTLLYTDGSKLEGKVGAAVSVWRGGREVFATKIKLANHCIVFQAELSAIKKALTVVGRGIHKGRYIILSDSLSALLAIQNTATSNPLVFEIQKLLHEPGLQQKQIKMGWVKAHAGTEGNERADILAKSAALHSKSGVQFDNVSLSCARRLIRDQILDAWQEEYQQAATGSRTKIIFPNVRTAYKILKKLEGLNNLMAQLFTGPGGFRSYLYKYNLADSPFCTCDNVTEETVLHVVFYCPKYDYKRLEAECRMGRRMDVDTVPGLLEDDDCRDVFLQFAMYAVRAAVARNGGRVGSDIQ